MSKLLWIVAQNPKTTLNIKQPLVNTKTLKILNKWLGESSCVIVTSNACSNLGKPRLTKQDKIRLKVTYEMKKPDKVIALGKIASRALYEIGVDHFKAEHPSGLNRKLNDKKYVDSMVISMRRYIKD